MGTFVLKKGKSDYHMTALGYGVVAKKMKTLVETIIEENHLNQP